MPDENIKQKLLEALKRVKGPDLESNIVDLGLLSEIVMRPDSSETDKQKIYFSILIDPKRAQELEPLRQAAEEVVQSVIDPIEDISAVVVSLTADLEAGKSQAGANGASSAARAQSGPAASAQPASSAPSAAPVPPSGTAQMPPASGGGKISLPGVKAIIAVASGKGGVGKSTTSVNLALGFQANGLKVGILDADIYGPSLPRLLGISGRPQTLEGKTLKPMQGYGLQVMSMGFLVDEATPMIWRGPMVMSAISQMLRDVAWGELDVLVVDMPPGTGDAQLTLAQQVSLSGAVIVSTPQDLALIDARKGLNMFQRVDVPVLGIIENMSYFLCPHCGERSDIFGHGGARDEAKALGLGFLGEVPLHMDIRAKSDAGQPIVVTEPEGEHAKIYRALAEKTWSACQQAQTKMKAQTPNIVIE